MTIETMPSALDIEHAVLGAAVLDGVCAEKLAKLPELLFYRPSHKIIANAVTRLIEKGAGVDQLTVANELERTGELDDAGGEAAIAAIACETRSTANFHFHTRILREKAALRKIIRMAVSAANAASGDSADPLAIAKSALVHLQGVAAGLDGDTKPLSEMVREWVLVTDGVFSVTDCYKDLELVTCSDKTNCRRILLRLTDEGLIERWGSRRGTYRKIEGDCQRMDWLCAESEKLDLAWPFGIERYVDIMPGNIAVIAGEPNSGKTAFLLNFVRMNMDAFDIHYFSSEMGPGELSRRIGRFDGISPGQWRFHPWERSGDFADVVRPGAVNVFDFLEIHEDFYKVGGTLKAIHDRLGDGIAVIALQKNRNTDLGRGGIATLEKPRLYLSLSPGECTIVKGKNWAQTGVNPNNMKFRFKLVSGANFSWEDWM